MKKIIIKTDRWSGKFNHQDNHITNTFDLVVEGEKMTVSDGYHTMDELYDHRISLFIALCKQLQENHIDESVWRSKLHHDGSSFEGWFILGINEEQGEQITYHLPLSRWSETDFARTLEKAPEWDKHTPDDVLKRLKQL